MSACLPDVVQMVDLTLGSVCSLCFVVRGSSAGRSSCCSAGHLITHTHPHEHTQPTLSHMGVNDVYWTKLESWGKNYLCNIFNGVCALWAATQAIIPHTGLLLHHTLQPIKFIFYLKNNPNTSIQWHSGVVSKSFSPLICVSFRSMSNLDVTWSRLLSTNLIKEW